MTTQRKTSRTRKDQRAALEKLAEIRAATKSTPPGDSTQEIRKMRDTRYGRPRGSS